MKPDDGPRTPRPGRIVRLFIAHAVIVSVCLGRVARAQSDSAETEALIRQGVALRMKKEDERALPFFQKAYERARTPRTAGQLGLAEMSIGYWTDAERHLAEALETTDHPWIAKNRKTLEDTLAQVRVNIGEVSIAGSPAGASVSLNGRPVGTLPLPAALRVNRGVIEITIRAPGYVASAQSIRLAGQERQRLTVALEKMPVPGLGARVDGEPQQGGMKRVGEPLNRDSATKDKPGMGSQRKWAWGMAIGGALAMGFGAAETVVWQKKRIDFNNHQAPPPDNPNVTDRTMWIRDCNRDLADRGSAMCKSLYDSSRHAEVWSFVGYSVGAALVAGSAILFMGDDAPEVRGTAAACAPFLGPGLACSLAF